MIVKRCASSARRCVKSTNWMLSASISSAPDASALGPCPCLLRFLVCIALAKFANNVHRHTMRFSDGALCAELGGLLLNVIKLETMGTRAVTNEANLRRTPVRKAALGNHGRHARARRSLRFNFVSPLVSNGLARSPCSANRTVRRMNSMKTSSAESRGFKWLTPHPPAGRATHRSATPNPDLALLSGTPRGLR